LEKLIDAGYAIRAYLVSNWIRNWQKLISWICQRAEFSAKFTHRGGIFKAWKDLGGLRYLYGASSAFFGTTRILSYAVLTQSFPIHLDSKVNMALNMLLFIATFGRQWAIGTIMYQWPDVADGRYAPASYRADFSMMLAWQVVTMLLYISANMKLKVAWKSWAQEYVAISLCKRCFRYI